MAGKDSSGSSNGRDIREVLRRIRDDPEYSDRYLVSRRAIPEMLDAAVIDDWKRGLRGDKEHEELEIIKHATNQLVKIKDNNFSKVNEQHDLIISGLRERNEEYDKILRQDDSETENLDAARINLIQGVINAHPSRLALVDFTGRISECWLDDKHYGLFGNLLFDFNPTLGYLVKQDNKLDIGYVVEAIMKTDIKRNEPRIIFSKESELSRKVMKAFTYDCWKNDGRLDSTEITMNYAYGDIIFRFRPDEIEEMKEEMFEENEAVEKFARQLSKLDKIEARTDAEQKAKNYINTFMNVLSKAYDDNQFTPQEEEICRTFAKYAGIRTYEARQQIINYCKKKVLIANSNSQVSDAIARLLNRTAIMPMTVRTGEAFEAAMEHQPRAIIVDVDKRQETTNLIINLMKAGYLDTGGKLYGVTSERLDPEMKSRYKNMFYLDDCFPSSKVMGRGSLTETLENDLDIHKPQIKQRANSGYS